MSLPMSHGVELQLPSKVESTQLAIMPSITNNVATGGSTDVVSGNVIYAYGSPFGGVGGTKMELNMRHELRLA